MFESFGLMYKYRALIWALVVRHLAIRYRGSALGFLWSLLNPLFLMLVYMLVFKYYIRFDHVENYTIFLFCGLLPWLWFSTALLEGTSSIVSSGHLITKSMFPPQILPAVAALTNMINFLLSLPLLFVFMIFYGLEFHLSLLALPIVILVQLVFIFGLSLIFSALNVYFRDVQHLLGNALTFLFFLCPILYPATTVPEAFRFTLDLNPLAVMTIFYQELILDGVLPSLSVSAYLLGIVGITLIVGNMVFESNRENFAELL